MGAAVDTSISLRSKLSPTVPAPAGRLTTPAPVQRSAQHRTDVPSARPTSVPDFDLDALATACLHDSKRFAMPMDTFVPVRTAAGTQQVGLREAFLLLHVDGTSTLADIAKCAQLPLEDVVTSFFNLAAVGAVQMSAAAGYEVAPESGVFPRCDIRLDDEG